MTTTLTQAMTRLVAMEKEAVASLYPGGVDGVPYFPYQQEGFPYWTNQQQSWFYDRSMSEDIEVRVTTVQARLILAHVTSGYEGENLKKISEIIPAVEDFFDANYLMTSTAFPDPLDFIFDFGEYHGLECSGGGFAIITNAGVEAQQLAVQFTLRLPIIRSRY